MGSRADAKKKRQCVPLTAEIEPTKPKVLTREELHRELDFMLDHAAGCGASMFGPVVIPKWKYDELVRSKKTAEQDYKFDEGTIRGLRSDVSRLKEIVEYYEGVRPISEIHSEDDRIKIEWQMRFPRKKEIEKRAPEAKTHAGILSVTGKAFIEGLQRQPQPE